MHIYIYIYIYIHTHMHIYIHTYTAQIVFIHKTFVGKSVHIFMARNRVSKSCLMAELCFHRFVHFDCVSTYIFGFHHKQCASN